MAPRLSGNQSTEAPFRKVGECLELSEAELMQRVIDGDKTAYQVLLDRHLAPLTRYIGRMLNSPAETEDIRQEVFLRLWTQTAKWRPEVAALSTWLHRIAHNLCIDYLRRRNRFIDEPVDEPVGGDEPDFELLKSRTGIDVGKAMAAIPERQRSAIIMCHYQGMSNKAAADILDVSVDALESLLSRGRRALRKLLSP